MEMAHIQALARFREAQDALPAHVRVPRQTWRRPALRGTAEVGNGNAALRLRRHREVFEGVLIPVVSRPDAAASKLAWASKGSHKSRRDLRQIVRHMPQTERAELDRLAGLLGLRDLLAEILGEPDEIAG
jgi:hypothetical protein